VSSTVACEIKHHVWGQPVDGFPCSREVYVRTFKQFSDKPPDLGGSLFVSLALGSALAAQGEASHVKQGACIDGLAQSRSLSRKGP